MLRMARMTYTLCIYHIMRYWMAMLGMSRMAHTLWRTPPHGANGSGSFTILYCNIMYIEHAHMQF